jgi:hypothetical protein
VSEKPGAVHLAQCISRLRDKLIDLSKRNRLISFKHSERGATYVRVVDENPDLLFRRLQTGEMSFEPLPDLDQEPEDEKTSEFKMALERGRLTDVEYLSEIELLGEAERDEEKAEEIERRLRARVRESLGLPQLHVGGKPNIQEFARAHGFNPSYELENRDGAEAKHLTDNKIRVLYTQDRLETRLRTIHDRYRAFAAETGIHTLQVAFGFVEWREDDASTIVHHAPLLLMPVLLTRELVRGHYVYRLSGADEDVTLNIALQQLLRRDFSIELPDIDEDETPNRYFAKIEPILEPIPRLSLRRFVTIGIFAFHRMALWWDLDSARWPDQSLLRHDDVGLLLGARGNRPGSGDATFPADYPIEDEPFATTAPVLILPADVSQHSALLDAMNGRSLAIEGPPGTGKSQTIANLIAAALDAGKRVLFCAEKRAALDVVAKRLVDRGFGPLMLELHSDRATKGEVIDSLAKRDKALPPRNDREIDLARSDLKQQRDMLRRYLTLLRQPIGELGQPVNALLWRMLRLEETLAGALPPGFHDLLVAQPEGVTAYDFKQSRQILDTVERTAANIQNEYGSLTASLWHVADRLPATPFGQEEVLDRLRHVINAVDQLIEFAEQFEAEVEVAFPRTQMDADRWFSALSRLPHVGDDVSLEWLHVSLVEPDGARRLSEALCAWLFSAWVVNGVIYIYRSSCPTPM